MGNFRGWRATNKTFQLSPHNSNLTPFWGDNCGGLFVWVVSLPLDQIGNPKLYCSTKQKDNGNQIQSAPKENTAIFTPVSLNIRTIRTEPFI